ncbi:hypothetical protein [Corynebacterium diphtheriae]|uniref:Membrane protein n=3 Tax=Corynebacterium diphtheriae TaxID=1717 RepID=Q6NFP8_CORDI|nr:hypothetical protein [Corynebacterium diphtheriae]AEX72697.1 hypothetical protein CDCE8392_1711 [Corynebacterium diphtheriae CDCE 8392]AVH82664.1 hypothetical protein A6J36_11905 [Corynebacterium diphtheriae]KKA80650.1 hypothetical protein VN94_09940 [Corynebacterium diphtheriae]MBG9228546.1 hypothetical protein [Corynebacterium diphtheriae bv. gravis]MBG9251300.1 hypothetical protein [Corynebacterium diphtheriae bv. mitis]
MKKADEAKNKGIVQYGMGALIGVIAGLVVNVLGFLLSNLPSVAQVFWGWKTSNRISSLR